MSIEALEKHYSNLIRPSNFIKMFKDSAEFREWAEIGTVKDLDWTIKNFEIDELYEYCIILKEVRCEKLLQEKRKIKNV